jgi:2-polyprenyl-3-methyl-5-hydroxy-6-metoxy-1,4-benzoquinol methylase
MDRSKLFEGYQQSVFSAGNTFSEREYAMMSEFYSANYGPFLPAKKDTRILDVGCGAGHFLYFLKAHGYTSMTGIDLSPELVELCRQKIWPDVVKVEAAEYLRKFPAGFEVISANDIVEHIPKGQIIDFLSACRGGLAPQGFLVIKVPNMSNPFAMDLRYRDFTHEAGYTESSLHQVLYLAGFKKISIVGSVHPGKGLKAGIHRIAEKVLHSLVRRSMMEMNYTVPSSFSKLIIAVAQG